MLDGNGGVLTRHEIRLEGPRTRGTAISAELLRGVLDVVLEGSRRAVRMRTQGRSSAPGASPRWIDAAADYTVELRPGSTVLEFEIPSLLEAAPETFGQADFLSDLDPHQSSFHYFAESLAAAVEGKRDSTLYDRGLLDVFRRLDDVLDQGATRITVEDDRRIVITKSDLQALANLEAEIPEPQYVKVTGRLDQIRASDRTFTLLSTSRNQTLKGIAEPRHRQQLQALWGKTVMVGGMAHFTPAGGLLRLDADRLREASPREESLWDVAPRSLGTTIRSAQLRVPQGARSGLNAIFGKWPGAEPDEQILEALEQLS